MFRDQKSGSQKVLVTVTHTGHKTDFFKKKMEKTNFKSCFLCDGCYYLLDDALDSDIDINFYCVVDE